MGRIDYETETMLAFNWNAQPDQMKFDSDTSAPLTCSQESAVCLTGQVMHTLKADGFDASEDGTGRGTPIVTAFSCKDFGADAGPVAPTLRSMNHAGSHQNGGGQAAMQFGMQVRRLTPMECERLQGFRDGHTKVAHRGKPAADGPRYKALGNSMAVPVIRWIGRQLELVELFQ